MHSGTILMALYGKFVFPKEFWKLYFTDDNDSRTIIDEADNLLLKNSTFIFETKTLFTDCDNLNSSVLKNNVFLNRFRNSISHARVEIDDIGNIHKFTNKNTQDEINFSVEIGREDLIKVLNEFNAFYIQDYNPDFK